MPNNATAIRAVTGLTPPVSQYTAAPKNGMPGAKSYGFSEPGMPKVPSVYSRAASRSYWSASLPCRNS